MRRRLSPEPRVSRHLLIRPFHRRDVEAMVDAVEMSLPDLRKWLPWAQGPYRRGDAASYIRESGSAWNEGRAFDFTIRRPEDPDRHLGNVSVWWTSRSARVGEIGYWIRSDEAGKGIGTEAAARVLGVAFDELEMHRVVVRIAVGNAGSERVADKLGFVREGLLREEVKVGAHWLDHSVWGLLEQEYRARLVEYAAAGWL